MHQSMLIPAPPNPGHAGTNGGHSSFKSLWTVECPCNQDMFFVWMTLLLFKNTPKGKDSETNPTSQFQGNLKNGHHDICPTACTGLGELTSLMYIHILYQ